MTKARLSLTAIAASLSATVCFGLSAGFAYGQDKPQKVVLRFASDVSPPPHPAGLAMKHFAERLPQVIPVRCATWARACARKREAARFSFRSASRPP